jgi:hypothetical protein
VGEQPRETSVRRHIFAISLRLAAAATSGAVFLAALLHEFAMVEVTATIVTSLQVFFLGSAIADMLEKKQKASGVGNSWAIVFAVLLMAFYFFTRYFH